MIKHSSPKNDSELRHIWWEKQKTNDYRNLIKIEKADKSNILFNLYNNLYTELLDKHSKQQQVVSWGFGILTGGGFISLILSSNLSIIATIAFSIALTFMTFALTYTIGFLSNDRMALARQLDRIHQLFKVFEKGVYFEESTLFDPIWSSWGFNKKSNSNWKLSKIYQFALWIIYFADVFILLNKAEVINFFK